MLIDPLLGNTGVHLFVVIVLCGNKNNQGVFQYIRLKYTFRNIITATVWHGHLPREPSLGVKFHQQKHRPRAEVLSVFPPERDNDFLHTLHNDSMSPVIGKYSEISLT